MSVKALEIFLLSAPDMVAIFNQDSGALVEVNDRFLSLSGYVREELIGKTMSELDLWVDIQDRIDVNGALVSDGYLQDRALPLRMSNGEIRTFRLSVNVVSIEGRPHNIAFFHDISDRIQAEDELKKARLLLERAEEMAKIGSWEFNFLTGDVVGSPGAHRIYGVSQESLSVEVAESVPLPEYRPLLNHARDQLIHEAKPYDIEFKIKRISDGAILDVHSRAVWDDKSKILFGIIRDITEEKRAREILETLNTDLRREVGVTMGQLEDARRAQSRAETVARLNSLVAHLAHEINTPLGIALTGSSHLAEISTRDEEIGSTAQLVEDSVRKISNLVSEFKRLSLTSLPDGQGIGPQELPGFLELLIGNIDVVLNPGRSISVACDTEPWIDTFDFISVAEAVSELVKNAVIHNHGDVDVLITPRRNGNWLEFVVSDNGKGIEELIRDTLFEPFVTASLSAGRPGLGLSIIYNLIVEGNGGNLVLVDKSGPGAEFLIRVPIIQNPGMPE